MSVSKKTERSRSDSIIVSCLAIVRRAASVSAVMQKSVSLRPFELRSALDQRLGRRVHAKAKPLFEESMLAFCFGTIAAG